MLPQLENALLAGHDVIFLGERGQAKTRMIRSLTGLLDEWMPIVAGTEINDDPYAPVSKHARDLVAEQGDDTPIDWVHRDERFGEKLATPDTSIADLIGEVDPIKVAEGRYLSDELTLHYGLVPRTNRGIFAINELPDLAERIQVGLLNVLEERDVQIRGYKIRLPLDVMLVASANPEDYTNRGRIITPLKDRFGSQIRTHYPLEVATEVAIMRQEARPLVDRVGDVQVDVPDYMAEIVATFSHLARAEPHQPALGRVACASRSPTTRRWWPTRSAGPAARASSTSCRASATSTRWRRRPAARSRSSRSRRAARARSSSTSSRRPCSRCSRTACRPSSSASVVDAFEDGVVAHTGEDVAVGRRWTAGRARSPALRAPVLDLTGGDESPAAVASAVEFVLEGLHLSKRLNKDASGARATYRGRT